MSQSLSNIIKSLLSEEGEAPASTPEPPKEKTKEERQAEMQAALAAHFGAKRDKEKETAAARVGSLADVSRRLGLSVPSPSAQAAQRPAIFSDIENAISGRGMGKTFKQPHEEYLRLHDFTGSLAKHALQYRSELEKLSGDESMDRRTRVATHLDRFFARGSSRIPSSDHEHVQNLILRSFSPGGTEALTKHVSDMEAASAKVAATPAKEAEVAPEVANREKAAVLGALKSVHGQGFLRTLPKEFQDAKSIIPHVSRYVSDNPQAAGLEQHLGELGVSFASRRYPKPEEKTESFLKNLANKLNKYLIQETKIHRGDVKAQLSAGIADRASAPGVRTWHAPEEKKAIEGRDQQIKDMASFVGPTAPPPAAGPVTKPTGDPRARSQSQLEAGETQALLKHMKGDQYSGVIQNLFTLDPKSSVIRVNTSGVFPDTPQTDEYDVHHVAGAAGGGKPGSPQPVSTEIEKNTSGIPHTIMSGLRGLHALFTRLNPVVQQKKAEHPGFKAAEPGRTNVEGNKVDFLPTLGLDTTPKGRPQTPQEKEFVRLYSGGGHMFLHEKVHQDIMSSLGDKDYKGSGHITPEEHSAFESSGEQEKFAPEIESEDRKRKLQGLPGLQPHERDALHLENKTRWIADRRITSAMGGDGEYLRKVTGSKPDVNIGDMVANPGISAYAVLTHGPTKIASHILGQTFVNEKGEAVRHGMLDSDWLHEMASGVHEYKRRKLKEKILQTNPDVPEIHAEDAATRILGDGTTKRPFRDLKGKKIDPSQEYSGIVDVLLKHQVNAAANHLAGLAFKHVYRKYYPGDDHMDALSMHAYARKHQAELVIPAKEEGGKTGISDAALHQQLGNLQEERASSYVHKFKTDLGKQTKGAIDLTTGVSARITGIGQEREAADKALESAKAEGNHEAVAAHQHHLDRLESEHQILSQYKPK